MDVNQQLETFINTERKIFNSLNTKIDWDSERWDVEDWLFHRGKDKYLVFNAALRISGKIPNSLNLPKKGQLPHPYIDFVKALVVYFRRTKGIGYMALRNCVIECRRLYIILYNRKERSPAQLTRWHFEETILLLKAIGYKNLFDAATCLKTIADLIDLKKFTPSPIDFNHGIKSGNRYYHYDSIKSTDINERTGNDKLPSFEALKAYAVCTNNPIDDNEEILLRTIDLLIAMGLRGNEVTFIPYDCWTEEPLMDKKGKKVRDLHGNLLVNVGIRYYAEKQFQPRIHWLANQDIPLAKRAVNRLKVLTAEAREVLLWQEANPCKIWKYDKQELISDVQMKTFLGFNRIIYLQGYLRRHGVTPVKTDKSYFEYRSEKSRDVFYSKIYRAGDVEDFLLSIKPDSINLKSEDGHIVLKTSEILPLRFQGSFRFKRKANTFKVFVESIPLQKINGALGSIPGAESIFERRNLTEADGSKIKMTSHQPRHWRNTLYELAGMSNVQQALAMGRQNLTQNKSYQHTTTKEKTKLHQDFLGFDSVKDKVTFLRDGVRNKSILGEITETYHHLKAKHGLETADTFLNTHGLAIHLTPFGGCTHDFSQSPCKKHLQCWNGCGHLHRTNAPGETERIKEQLRSSESILKKMKSDSTKPYGQDVWVKDLEMKIKNLKKALKLNPSSTPIQLFPDGKEITKPISKRRNSSV
ncbi:hypothetical protein [Flagellimonas sp.]|uniref:hypothetical protein n=1 Tax=Flagellimonas sp. TaxID=2058762 RepID=UPI003B5217C6